MLRALKLEKKGFSSAIAGDELETREPSLPVLLRYARLVAMIMDIFVDDKMELPT